MRPLNTARVRIEDRQDLLTEKAFVETKTRPSATVIGFSGTPGTGVAVHDSTNAPGSIVAGT
ncbi:MAG: hypothetical protein JWM41_4111 [Gemmatimonadetes bacterium]|nr:hypothetical protein [Gemmatimonadota bacterium]